MAKDISKFYWAIFAIGPPLEFQTTTDCLFTSATVSSHNESLFCGFAIGFLNYELNDTIAGRHSPVYFTQKRTGIRLFIGCKA